MSRPTTTAPFPTSIDPRSPSDQARAVRYFVEQGRADLLRRMEAIVRGRGLAFKIEDVLAAVDPNEHNADDARNLFEAVYRWHMRSICEGN